MAKAVKKGIGNILQLEKFEAIFSGFKYWHVDDFIKQVYKNNNKGGVLHFVRGLRLSAQLIYAIREELETDKLSANWGHILDDNDTFCSRECDIIIHKGKAKNVWNGNKKDSIMDFRFIPKDKVVAVISCKSFVDKSVVVGEKKYCTDMKKFAKKIWFFGECCEPHLLTNIKTASKTSGFDKCWLAYTWNKKTDDTVLNYKEWQNFISEIKKLK
jgi:hypothetical protein